MKLVLVCNIVATFFMVGVIWFIQIVHYPLYTRINPDAFPNYEVAHINLVTPVVVPIMFLEAITAVLLLLSPIAGIPLWLLIAGLVIVVLIWSITFFVTVPQHNVLSYSFDSAVHRTLMLTNWSRTVLWTARGLLMCWVLYQTLPA